MENPFNIPKKTEKFEPTEVKVRDKIGDKNYMLIFNSGNSKICTAYNEAIEIILSKHNMRPFHQIGTINNDPGVHGWEVWQETTKEYLEKLIPEVQAEAKQIFEDDVFI